jgi:CRP/FNR family transcriptional regulator, cyclic AMP receptor protein
MSLVFPSADAKKVTLLDRISSTAYGNGETTMSVVRPIHLRHDEAIQKFLEHCHRRQFTPKSTIIRQGDPSHDLFYIVKGSVTVLLEDDEGRELVLAYLNPGDFFGEIGLFNEHVNRSALVRAKSACEVATISYERLKSMSTIFPDLLFAISSQLATRLRKMNRKVGDLAFMDVSGRVARSLLDLCKEPDAMTHPDGMQIRVTRQELGRIVGCSREMVGRVLKSLEEQHLISVSGKTIVVFGVR